MTTGGCGTLSEQLDRKEPEVDGRSNIRHQNSEDLPHLGHVKAILPLMFLPPVKLNVECCI